MQGEKNENPKTDMAQKKRQQSRTHGQWKISVKQAAMGKS